jgi:hypothetical protein
LYSSLGAGFYGTKTRTTRHLGGSRLAKLPLEKKTIHFEIEKCIKPGIGVFFMIKFNLCKIIITFLNSWIIQLS